ncbi:hypothetical protein C1N91_14605 [Curtobacterium sp. SGAir0471]|uniref:hypothetical protein n=1 Tax=Curtobacterium sp. SGAir0471 TaxID=2070337 RepID=UPI0010CD5D3B|nr:hypothetical protein [Curtobacterium sp. SGAir0471]QCR44569.1 hypothetical protein C1N91_14605 [Curtobacterium sp. SGAir0471]
MESDSHGGVLIACGKFVVVGTLIPLLLVGRAAPQVLVYVLIGALFGCLVGGLSVRFRPVTMGMPMVVVLILVVLFVFERVDGLWAFAVPLSLFGSFVAASVGSHLRSQAWTARTR